MLLKLEMLFTILNQLILQIQFCCFLFIQYRIQIQSLSLEISNTRLQIYNVLILHKFRCLLKLLILKETQLLFHFTHLDFVGF
jgi:hypothetical protein